MTAVQVPAWLTAPMVTLAWCWRLERRDGAVIGLTSHDQPLVVDGLRYGCAPGLVPGRISQTADLEGEAIDIEGTLSAASITLESLRGGRWEGALLTLMVVDWSAADLQPVVIAQGRLGQVAARDGAFVAEVQSKLPQLDAPALPSTSPHCRAVLGDRSCRVDVFGLRTRAELVAGSGAQATVALTVGQNPQDYAGGTLRLLVGAHRGWRAMIIGIDEGRFRLSAPLPAGTNFPQLVELEPGCDKRLHTCKQRFNNVGNFRGEPHLPDADALTRYVGQ